jgi:hypothetical protein
MYTVGLDADTFVSILKGILITTIKLLAGNIIFNLSPPLLRSIFLLYINLKVTKLLYLILKENRIFSLIYKSSKNIIFTS